MDVGKKITNYLKENTIPRLLKAPDVLSPKVLIPLLAFSVFSFFYGENHDLFGFGMLRDSDLIWFLPLTLFLFPSLLEELVFRALLIPISKERKPGRKLLFIAISTILFVAWHPFNALTINPGAQYFFLNPHFLVIVAALGITCSYTYIESESLWVPVLIHWLTVIVWVFMLGGRNLVLE